MSKPQLIIVANRLPVKVIKKDGELTFVPSDGGLATAMSSIPAQRENLWIGWPGISSEDLTADDKKKIIVELRKFRCFPVFLTNKQVKSYYLGYANATIWPLFHYFAQYVDYNGQYWSGYKQVNKLFANEIAKQATPKTSFWIHDYHFLLLPQLLRQKLPGCSIGFFLHTPFPSSEIFRLLPNGTDIIKGMLGADLIGFQTHDYARHFLSSVTRTLGYSDELGIITLNDRHVATNSFPIGIDYEKFNKAGRALATKKELRQLQKQYRGQRIILSVDRVDYSKGILKRLEAFDSFLAQNPDWWQKTTLLMIGVPSRSEIDVYKNLNDKINIIVSRINKKYATADWSPVIYRYQSVSFAHLIALYRLADIALVTPLRDGMNLVAKEYVAVKQRSKGVLILSEMAGAANEMPEAILVNPIDTQAIAAAIASALIMPRLEQRRRLRAIQKRLSKFTAQRWSNNFLQQLQKHRTHHTELTGRILQPADRKRLIHAYKTAKNRLILLDYDGTLANFTSQPNSPSLKPTPQLLSILTKLQSPPGNEVVIVSGRSKRNLEQWFKGIPISLVAEHGAWIKEKRTWTQPMPLQQDWQTAILRILNTYHERTPGSIVEQKDYALVWHYRNVPPELAFARNDELRQDIGQAIQDQNVGIFDGNKVIEIKPLNINKGVIAKQKSEARQWDFILAIGDDDSDEALFATLPKTAFTLKVGLKLSAARFHIQSVETVIQLLQAMVDTTNGPR